MSVKITFRTATMDAKEKIMPATVTTKEPIASDVTAIELQGAINIRMQAGAIRAWVEVHDGQRVLMTEWNVFGVNE